MIAAHFHGGSHWYQAWVFSPSLVFQWYVSLPHWPFRNKQTLTLLRERKLLMRRRQLKKCLSSNVLLRVYDWLKKVNAKWLDITVVLENVTLAAICWKLLLQMRQMNGKYLFQKMVNENNNFPFLDYFKNCK